MPPAGHCANSSAQGAAHDSAADSARTLCANAPVEPTRAISRLHNVFLSVTSCELTNSVAKCSRRQRRSVEIRRTFVARPALRRHEGVKFGHTCFEQSSVEVCALSLGMVSCSARAPVARRSSTATADKLRFIHAPLCKILILTKIWARCSAEFYEAKKKPAEWVLGRLRTEV